VSELDHLFTRVGLVAEQWVDVVDRGEQWVGDPKLAELGADAQVAIERYGIRVTELRRRERRKQRIRGIRR
jgi:hypothetical protein